MTELVTGLNVHQTILHDLSPFTEYVVVVRLYCSQQDGVGQASATISFTTEAIGENLNEHLSTVHVARFKYILCFDLLRALHLIICV